jgi:putative nucleotidyltransferase with HDIG domain
MKKKFFRLPVYVFFFVVTLLLIIYFPREGKFRYSFVTGKPWQYGLLTAPFDFPIHKSAEQLKQEQDSIAKNFVPYFRHNPAIELDEINRFDEDFLDHALSLESPNYKLYIEKTLKKLYSAGIISTLDYDFLTSHNYPVFSVLKGDGKTETPGAVPFALKNVFTVKSAYTYLLNNCPSNLDENMLRSANLSNYLIENIQYDEETSEKVRQERLQQVSPSRGMVQGGEKIIDRGEIVDEKTYNILYSLKIISEQEAGSAQRQAGLIIGIVLLIGGFMACFFFYFYYLRDKIYEKKKDIVFFLTMITIFTLLTEISVSYGFFSVYVIPYAMIPLVVRTFFDSRTAQMTHFTCIMICSLIVPFAFEFIVLQSVVCMVSIYVLKDLSQRSQLVRCSFFILGAYVITYLGFLLFQEGDILKIHWDMLLFFAINFVFVMFTYPFIYILEKIFGYISNVTLVELSDINTPLLRSLSENTPGTFQHSLQVSMLGTAAATKVGANPQLVRTGALYHDIGKTVNPAYFTENKIEGNNPHEHLTFEESARIITNHVPEGVKIAEKNRIPEAIIKFIKTHHGTGKAKYFYNSFKNQYPDAEINEEAFTYSGTNPDTKETAILMMADSVEAASRSLKDYSEKSIQDLVERIINGQIADGLLNDAPLTFKNISEIKNVFVDKLVSVYHSRISYPELKTNTSAAVPE